MVKPHNGLLPISHDTSKDFSYYNTFLKKKFGYFGSNLLPGLPKTLGRKPVCINDQDGSDYCTGFLISESIGNQVGIPMSPEYQVAKEGEIAGSPIFQGTDPKTALTSGIKYGALPKSTSLLTFQQNGYQIPAEYQEYAAYLDTTAALYRRASYYNVLSGNPGDFNTFDMVKLALWDSKDDNGGNPNNFPSVMNFGWWYDSWNKVGADGIVPQMVANEMPISRHAYSYFDFDTINGVDYLLAQLSQGETFGEGGILKFTREQVNYAWQPNSTIGMYIYRSTNPSWWDEIKSIFSWI